MKRLLITALSLLLVFNGAEYQVINATEVDTQGKEISETSLPTEETDGSTDTSKEETNLEESNKENADANVSSEETNSNDSDEENTDTNVSTEENNDAVNDTTVDDTVQDSDSIDTSEAQIATVANEPIQELNKDNFRYYLRNYLSNKKTDLYFGTKADYTVDLAKCTENADLGNGYKIYNYTDATGVVKAYVVCENGKQIIFPENSSSMFYDVKAILRQIIFSPEHINTSNVTDMNNMFFGCNGLTSLDLTGFDTENVTDMSWMFTSCGKLSSLKLSSLDVSKFSTKNVTNMKQMFSGCDSLTSLDLTGFDTENVTNMSGMFYNCKGLISLNLTGFETKNVTDMEDMFYGCKGLTSLNITSFNTKKVTDMEGMFDGCHSLTELDLSKFDTSNVISMQRMFADCFSLTELDLSKFNTSKVTNMGSMFMSCKSLVSLMVSQFKTSNVTRMGGMFYACKSLAELDVSQFDTSKVTDMGIMFYDCSSLTKLDVSQFDTSKVTNMQSMFYNCKKLTELDVSNFNTSEVTGMYSMFLECNQLKELDVSNFNTANVTNMAEMFSKCSNLTMLDISSFDTSKVREMNYMFNECKNLKTIYANINFVNSDNSAHSMFFDCTKLVGGNGTKYTGSETSDKYACIDGRNSKPGYFTAVGPDKPTLSITETYKYNGNEQIASVIGFDSNTMEITDNKKTNAGTYTIKVTSKTGRWSDGTKDPVTIEWTIEKADPNPDKPTNLKAIQGDTLSEVKLPSGWSWNEPNTQIADSGSKTYKATFTPTDTKNYKVLDNIELTVDVEAASIKPTLSISGEYTYNGNEQTANVNGFDSNTMEITDNKKTNAGTYTVTVKPKTQWADGTNTPVTVEWIIKKADATKPSGLSATQGDKLSDIQLPNGWKWDEPDTQITNNGTQTFKASYIPTGTDADNYNESKNVDLTVSVEAAPDKPVLSITGTYTYNGSEQTVTVTGFDSNTMEITGNKQTNAGTYTVTVKPKTQWSDGTNSPVTVEWTIEKANPTYTVPTDLKANQGDKLSDIKLPEGWSWNEPDTKLDASGSKSYTASYTPKDTSNYNVIEKVELTINIKAINKSSDNSSIKQTNGWDDGGPFTTDKCGNVFDRWNNKIYDANGCNVGGYNLVKTSVID